MKDNEKKKQWAVGQFTWSKIHITGAHTGGGGHGKYGWTS